MGGRTFIKMYFKHESTFLQVRIMFNMHFFNTMNTKMESLLPVSHSYDMAKVFFTSVLAAANIIA